MATISFMPQRKRAWAITSTALEKFIRCMDGSPARAAEKYEEMQTRLVRFFEWQGCHTPEEAADTTLDRAIRKIDEGAVVPNVPSFLYGVARLVLREYWKNSKRDVSLSIIVERAAPETSDNIFLDCVERCLPKLPADGRAILLEYYSDMSRQELAGKQGLSINALRLRISRLMQKLEDCALPCAEGNSKGRRI